MKELTRRDFLASSAALPFGLQALANPREAAAAGSSTTKTSRAPRWVLLGSDTGKGISRAAWDPATGKLGPRELAVPTKNPSFLTLHPTLAVLYCTNERSSGAISSFTLDTEHDGLTPLNEVSTSGSAPCFIAVDRQWDALLAANYSSGSVACLPVRADGQLADASTVLAFPADKHGPVADRQEGSHMHCTTISPDPEFVLCCDLGDDVIRILRLHDDQAEAAGGHRVPEIRQVEAVAARAGSGPRHVAFHPKGRWLYCIHEIDCTIDMFEWSVDHGKPSLRFREGSVAQTLLPGTALTGNTACEIIVSPDGRFLYASTRGVDEITTYRIDPRSGALTLQQRFSCGGVNPRYMAFDPSRRWLVSCNQAAPGSVTVFAHDPATGHIDTTPQSFAADTPMFVLWI